MRRTKLLIHLKSSLWFVPVLCVLAGAALSFGTIALDRYFDYEALPTRIVGGPDAAAYILSTVAASMVSLTALVLTITMVVVQLAMGQFSPRIVQRILRDKPSQLAIGLFVATFVHAILALREVTITGRHGQRARHRGRDGVRPRPPEHRSSRRVCAPHRTGTARLGAHRARRRPDAHASRPEVSGQGAGYRPSRLFSPRRAGSRAWSRDRLRRLVEEGRRADCLLELVPALGEFVPAGGPLSASRGVHCCGR